jgi:hypothetical protein
MDLVPPLVRPQPAPPKQQYSFTSWAVQHPTIPAPGNWLDSELAHAHRTVRSLIDWAAVSLNSDGSLRPDAVRHALSIPVSRDTDNSDSDNQYASNVAQDYAVLSAAWAEHMPDTIPPNILASNDITGDHWSSRWWANKAADILAQVGVGSFTDAPGDGVVYGRLNHAWTGVLPLTGGTMSGNLSINGALTLNGLLDLTGHNLAGLGQVQGEVVATGAIYAYGKPSQFGLLQLNSQRFLAWTANSYDQLDLTDGSREWVTNGTELMRLGGTGGLTVRGGIATDGNVTLSNGSSLTVAGAVNAANIVASGGVWANNQSASPTYGFNKSGPNYVFWWGVSGDYNYLDANGTWHWVQGGADRMSLTSAGSLAIPGDFSASGNINVSGNITCGGNFSPAGGVTAALHATGGGVSYPDISALGSGGNYAVGFDWNGNELTVWVNGAYHGRIPMTLPLAGDLEAKIVALEARIAALELSASKLNQA